MIRSRAERVFILCIERGSNSSCPSVRPFSPEPLVVEQEGLRPWEGGSMDTDEGGACLSSHTHIRWKFGTYH